MAIKDDKAVLYATVTKELKQKIQEIADKENRKLSQQVAYILERALGEKQDKDWYFELAEIALGLNRSEFEALIHEHLKASGIDVASHD